MPLHVLFCLLGSQTTQWTLQLSSNLTTSFILIFFQIIAYKIYLHILALCRLSKLVNIDIYFSHLGLLQVANDCYTSTIMLQTCHTLDIQVSTHLKPVQMYYFRYISSKTKYKPCQDDIFSIFTHICILYISYVSQIFVT